LLLCEFLFCITEMMMHFSRYAAVTL